MQQTTPRQKNALLDKLLVSCSIPMFVGQSPWPKAMRERLAAKLGHLGPLAMPS